MAMRIQQRDRLWSQHWPFCPWLGNLDVGVQAGARRQRLRRRVRTFARLALGLLCCRPGSNASWTSSRWLHPKAAELCRASQAQRCNRERRQVNRSSCMHVRAKAEYGSQPNICQQGFESSVARLKRTRVAPCSWRLVWSSWLSGLQMHGQAMQIGFGDIVFSLRPTWSATAGLEALL